MANGITKVTVNLPTSVIDALKDLAFARRTNLTEVIKSAIGTEKYIADCLARGEKILIDKGNGNIREVIFYK